MGTAVKSFTAYLPESVNYIDMDLVRGIFHAVQKRISFPVNAHFFTFPMIGYLYIQVPFARFRHIDNFFRPAVGFEHSFPLGGLRIQGPFVFRAENISVQIFNIQIAPRDTRISVC